MQIKNIQIHEDKDKKYVTADFIYKTRTKKTVTISVQKKYGHFLSKSASIFLPVGVVLASSLGEELDVEDLVSRKQLLAAPIANKLMMSWELGLHEVKVNANSIVEKPVRSKLRGIGSFFSGGVDSFYSLLKESNQKEITHLVFVRGFDILGKDDQLFLQAKKNAEAVARELNKELIVVETNIRDLTDPIFSWSWIHGAALAMVGLSLQDGLEKIYVPASDFGTHPVPWGSHPDLDPLWSTESTSISYDGGDMDRVQKIGFISHFSVALKYLRVCYKNVVGKYNCGACDKCVRTMVDLAIAGVLGSANTFPKKLDLAAVKKLPGKSYSENIYLTQSLEELRKKANNKYLEEALIQALGNEEASGFTARTRAFIAGLDSKYNKGKLYRFLARKAILK